jgi:uncharacterized protein YkwD
MPEKFLLFAVCVLLLQPLAAPAQKTSQSYTGLATGILRYVNEHRTGMGLAPLKMDPVIVQAAEKHSRNMATKKIPFGHEGFDKRMATLGKQLKSVYGWAENVLSGPQTAKEAVDAWLTSPVHKKNIEGDYNLTGMGIAKSAEGDLYYTEIFINKGK